MNNTKDSCFSSKTEDWLTPLSFFTELNKEFNFKCDPCTTKDNPLQMPIFYTKQDNGLIQKWYNACYCNPPYGKEIVNWIKKALEEQKNGVTTVMNLPARTDTKYFHEYLYRKNNIEIRFLKGRLKFVGVQKDYKRNSAPFPSMLAIFK